MASQCAICLQSEGDDNSLSTLGSKGAVTINTASKERGDSVEVNPGDKVHAHCRRDFSNQRRISSLKRCNESDSASNQESM